MVHLSHRPFIVPIVFLTSTRNNDPVCHRTIYLVRLTLFPSGMLNVTNILSRCLNDTPFCSELDGEHAGENFSSHYAGEMIVFEIRVVKVKIPDFAKI